MPPLPCLYSVGRQCVVCHWPYSPTKGERLVICPVIRRDLGTTRPGAGNGTAGGKASLRRWLPGFLALLALAWLALGAAPAVHAASFLERAQQLFEEGDLPAAGVELKNALRRDPNDAEARFLLGRIHLKLGDARSAEKELLRARELSLSDPELDLLLAYSQLGQQEFDAVVSGIDEELKADSALARDLFVARGEALLGLGRFDEAEAIFDRVLQDGPTVQALVNKARIDRKSTRLYSSH